MRRADRTAAARLDLPSRAGCGSVAEDVLVERFALFPVASAQGSRLGALCLGAAVRNSDGDASCHRGTAGLPGVGGVFLAQLRRLRLRRPSLSVHRMCDWAGPRTGPRSAELMRRE